MTAQHSETTDVLVPLTEATDPDLVGTKAATLAALKAAGLPVPDGVVIPAGSDDVSTSALTEAIGRWGDVPVAVRSSGIAEDLPDASYAGMYTTVLNVRGESALHAAVAKCRSSASAPGVLSYSGDVEPAGVAMLIQPMVDAAAAGVAFTADPVSGDRDVVVIDAVRGLGDQLVSGAVTPERWEVRTRAGRRTPDADQVIDAGTADEIAGLARRIADVQGGPQDVEWALTADGELVVLQARPITSLADEGIPVPVEVPEGRWIREASHAPLSGVPVAVVTLAAEAWQAAGMSPEALTIADTPAAMGPAAPYPAAMADRIRGSVESDPTLLRAAADRLLELGFAYEAAVACVDLAELDATQPGEIEDSLRVFERLGAQPQVNRARRLLRRHGQRVPGTARQRGTRPLSAREEQVARLAAAGLSNSEIAQKLYLSPRTITTHLHNIYRRLGLTSRIALVRFVLEELPPEGA